MRATRRHGLLLFTVVLLDLIGFGIVIPILPFISPRLGATEFDIAMIIASYAFCASIAAPFWGRLSDRMGRKPVLMICTVGAAVAYLMLALASQLWMIFAARAFAGIMAGNFAVASAVMADITPPSERASGMGLIGAAFGLGLVLGPVLGGLLSGPEGSFFLPCILASGMSMLAVVAAALFLPESHKPGEVGHHVQRDDDTSLWALLRASQCRLLMLQYFLHSSSVSAITYLWPLWVFALLDWSAREVGIVFGVQGAFMALTQGLLMGPLVRFLGELLMLRICVSVFLLGLVIAVFATGPVSMTASALIALSGATLCMPILNSFVSQRGARWQVGRLMGAGAAAASWGRVAGPLLAGVLLTFGGFTAAWHLPLAMVAAYLVWAFSRWAARPAPGVQELE